MLLNSELGTLSGATMFAPVQAMQPQPEVVEVETVDNNHFFDFEKAKVQSLTLEQLRRTVRENDGRDGVALHGIYHYELIDRIVDVCNANNMSVDIYDMFATNNRDKQTPGVSLYPELEQKFGERAVEAHSIRRLYTNIRLRDFDTDELTTNLAVSYTQKGIQIGIGRNVKICHNQCMLGIDRYISDFSVAQHKGAKLSPDEMVAKVAEWVGDLRRIVDEDDEIIRRMKATTLTPAQVLVIIGMLTTQRVQHDTAIKRICNASSLYPLNQAQICRFTEAMLVEQKDKGLITAWSMYNAATDLYKPQTAEQTLILPQNLSFVEFMLANSIVTR